MGQITEDFIKRAMRCCQLGQHPTMTVWEARQLLTAWVEWQGCRAERDKLDEANRICEQWRQWTIATRAENERLRQLYDNEHNETCRLRTNVAELKSAFRRLRDGISYSDNAHECDLADAVLDRLSPSDGGIRE